MQSERSFGHNKKSQNYLEDIKILVIEDDPYTQLLLNRIFIAADAEVFTAESGRVGLRKFFKHSPDLIVLDIMLPDIDGYDVCAKIREKSSVPIIMLTALNEEEDIIKGLDIGANDFLSKPFSQDLLLSHVQAVMRNSLQINTQIYDVVSWSSKVYYEKPRIYHKGLAETLAKTLGLRDPILPDHSLRVATFAAKLARRMGLTEEQVDLVRRGSLLHDIGKLGISQAILSKPGALTIKEYEIVKIHPRLGAALLQECPEYMKLIPIVLHHHEYFNGQGYPDKIAGEQIEIEARIVSVSEVVIAMSSNSPYRKARHTKDIIAELRKNAGTQFDPIVVERAIQILEKDETNN